MVDLARWFTRRFYGVMVSTWDSESQDPSSNLGRTFFFCFISLLFAAFTFFSYFLVRDNHFHRFSSIFYRWIMYSHFTDPLGARCVSRAGSVLAGPGSRPGLRAVPLGDSRCLYFTLCTLHPGTHLPSTASR